MVSTYIDLSMNLNNFCTVSISISISYSISNSIIISISITVVIVSVSSVSVSILVTIRVRIRIRFSISIIVIVMIINNIIILSFLVEEESILIISSCFAPTMHPLNATRLFLLKNINDYDISFLE